MSQPELHPIEASHLHARRERVFLIFAGLFLGTLAMLNLLGVTRFLDMSFSVFGVEVPFVVPVGVLPYPITFLCTDFISEFYGRRRANFVVWVGFGLNLWLVLVLVLGAALPGTDDPPVPDEAGRMPLFFEIREKTLASIPGSMLAYLTAQFCDVFLFHFWKKLTGGRHLWLRNNGSTVVSQLVDTTAVILVVHFFGGGLPAVRDDAALWPQLLTIIGSAYVFKLAVALADTVPFYIGCHFLSRYLRIDPRSEHAADAEEIALTGRGNPPSSAR